MNKVILIGGNHHNILGTARCFGINGFHPYGVIIGADAGSSIVHKSKYWAKTWELKADEEIPDFLVSNFANETEKPAVICCSDASAQCVDLNYDKLKKYFLLPSASEQQGKISELMNKQSQVDFANKYKIPMAKSFIVDLDNIEIPCDMVYPCIVKPVVSAEGKKADIKKCETREQTEKYLYYLKGKGYQRLLVQEYLEYDAEYLMVGAINKDRCCWFNSEKIRVWPVIGGSSSYLHISNNNVANDFYTSVRDAFCMLGYDGIFDVEAFYVKGKMYLNEINWRNSGTIYSAFSTKVYYPVIWYYWKTGHEVPNDLKLSCANANIYSMDESLDFRHVIVKNISLKQWINDCKRSKAFALWFPSDLKPSIANYWNLLRKLIRRRGV